MKILLIVLAVAVALYGLHRLASFAEERGWIYYRTRPPRVRMLGLLEELVEPKVEHQIEEQSSQEIRGDHAETGEGYGDDDGSG